MNLNDLILSLWLPGFLFYVLLQIYWWQIKEYRLDRFLVHLQTGVGKRLYLSKLNLLKLVTLGILLLSFKLGTFVFLTVYVICLLKYLKDLLSGKFNLAILTFRMISTVAIIILINLIFFLLFFSLLIKLAVTLVILDLLSPIFIAFSVLGAGSLAYFYKRRKILQAKEKIARFRSLTVIGVTGSFGKTTTKEFISQILSSKYNVYNVLVTPGHVNTELGIAQFILKELSYDTQFLVIEMGAYKPGEIKAICELVKPKIGVLTAIGNQHLSLFGSIDNITYAKFELIDSLPEDGIAILNADDDNIQSISHTYNLKKIFFSLKTRSDIYATNIQILQREVRFNLNFKKGIYPVSAPIIGKQNISNLLAAFAVGLELGVDVKSLIKTASRLEVPPSTMEVLQSKNKATLIDDSYSINPGGVKLALETLSAYDNFTKVAVLSPMLELGEETIYSYKEVLNLAQKMTDQIICIGLDFADVFKKLHITSKKIHFFKNTNLAVEFINKYDKSNTVILFEGRNSRKVLDKLL